MSCGNVHPGPKLTMPERMARKDRAREYAFRLAVKRRRAKNRVARKTRQHAR